jgi:hypothetical protein
MSSSSSSRTDVLKAAAMHFMSADVYGLRSNNWQKCNYQSNSKNQGYKKEVSDLEVRTLSSPKKGSHYDIQSKVR